MRDIALSFFVFGSIPWMIRRPFIGLLFWVWLSIMNPHRLTYGFAHNLPFAMIVALATLIGILTHLRTLHKPEWNTGLAAIVTFLLWICVSPLFSLSNGGEFSLWLRAAKILLMVIVAFFLVGERKEIHLLAIVLTVSIAYFGVKGGAFAAATGGKYKVWGPDDSFIADNNAIACAIIMTIPFLRYLQMQETRHFVRLAYGAAMALCAASALASYSRGALLGLVAMATLFWWKGRNKLPTGILAVTVATIAYLSMPAAWFQRMNTISTYKTDASAEGRINAWWMTFHLANDRFPIGGGFNIYTKDVFSRYAPNPDDVHAAHSIYYQALGEHGYIGLFLFLLIFGSAWRYGTWTIRHARGLPDLRWAVDLASMCQASLVGYAVAGAFLSLTYYDFPYYVAVILNVLRGLVARELRSGEPPASDITSIPDLAQPPTVSISEPTPKLIPSRSWIFR